MKKFLTGAIILFTLASGAYADNWKILNFGEELNTSLAELKQYCLLHDMTVDDVLWANRMESKDIKSGNFVYLPTKKADMLFVWQDRGKVSSAKVMPSQMITAQKSKTEAPAKIEPAKSKAKTPDKIINTKTAAKTQNDPAKAIASTTKQKPDKILANAQKKDEAKNNTIPGLMDPVIILSPNGDAANGPMRLVITGNKVEVVRLPQSAAPKKPSVSDLNNTLGNVPGYVPYYNMIPLRPNNSKNTLNNNNLLYQNLNGKMLWPLDGKVSSYFGPRGKRRHEGIDICMPGGTPIKAAKNGVVARTGNNSTIGFRGYGNFVLLDHGNGVQTFYAHCSKVAVVPGQRIMQGQVVGYVGSTGRSTGNHLHFEVRVNNVKVNPVPYLSGRTQLASK